MKTSRRLVGAVSLALALAFGPIGVEAATAAPIAVSIREATPRAGQFCKNVDSGKVVGNLICKHDANVNRNRWVVK